MTMSFARRLSLVCCLCAALLPNASQACGVNTFYAAICPMALSAPRYAGGFDNNTFMPADGRQLNGRIYSVLFSLIGTTYGGNSSNYIFNLPNLQGRLIIAPGQYVDKFTSPTLYKVGQQGGQTWVALTVPQMLLPPHTHPLSGTATAAAGLGTLAATTSMAGATATTSLAGVTAATSLPAATVDGSALTLYGSNGGTLSNTPFEASLATPTLPTRIYSGAAPNVAMASGNLGSVRGTAPITFGAAATTTLNGAPATTLGGAPITTLSGSPKPTLTGGPAVTIGGATGPTGVDHLKPQAITTMPPYVSMMYYIAVEGTAYPAPDN